MSTTDVWASPTRRPSHGRRVGRIANGVVAVAAGAPERLLLMFLAFCYVAAVSYVTGVFRPVVVFPATAVVIAVVWRFLPSGGARDVRAAWGSVLGLGVAALWFLLNLPYLAERVLVGRDPDIYTLTALWLRDHAGLSIPVPSGSTESPGFYLVGGVLEPQANHLVAGVAAAVGWVFGENAVFWGNLACGAAALLALYALGRQLVGPFWALVPVVGLSVSLPMLEFSRATYSEPLALTFTLLGATLLWTAWKGDRLAHYAWAGIAFGGVALARIDGTLPLIGVVVGLAIARFLHTDPGASRHRWAAPLLVLGSLPGVLLGFADLYFHSGRYVSDLASQFRELAAGFLLAIVIAVVLAFVPAGRLALASRLVSRAAVAGAGLAAVAFAVLLTRPWWYVGHGVYVPLIAGIQGAEHQAVDGTRTYAEDSFLWLSWYYGWPVVLVGLAGMVAWLVTASRRRSAELLWLAALLLPSAALYLTQPSIAPDQIWAMRRFLPVVIPGLLLATVWIARRLSSVRRPLGAILAAALVASVVGLPLLTTSKLWTRKDNAGALVGMEQMCGRVAGRPVIVPMKSSYLPTVRALCNVPADSVAETTPGSLAAARRALGGGPAVLVTETTNGIPWTGPAPAPSVYYTQRIWERTLIRPPAHTVTQRIGITFGLVQPDGSVAPLP